MEIFVYLCPKIMILHVFNPEHDLALASGLGNFTAPHAGRQLHSDLDFLPALWARGGDAVLVGNADAAFRRLCHQGTAAPAAHHLRRAVGLGHGPARLPVTRWGACLCLCLRGRHRRHPSPIPPHHSRCPPAPAEV